MNSKIILATILMTATTFGATAEFVCKADVTYSWKRGEEAEAVIYFDSAKANGADEAQAKAALLEKLSPVKLKASENCRKIHENVSGCINTKLTTASASLAALSFSARRVVEEAAAADCQKQSGKCTSVSSTEPTCAVVVIPGQATPTATPEAGKSGGKGKK
jgi:hypothetical protein